MQKSECGMKSDRPVGVELGKQLAGKILPALADDRPVHSQDFSTRGLINPFKEMRKNEKRRD
jgi:hypothetical protein